MTARIVGLLLISLSAAVLQHVSAGGAYCAKTARARAAALGLDYPGDRGAPDLFGPPHHAMHPGAPQHFPNIPQPPVVDYNLLYNLPQQFPLHPAGARSHTHTEANPLLSSLSGDESVNNQQSNFEQVKRVGPLTRAGAPGQADLVDQAFEGQNKPLPFVYKRRDLAVDASVPNRRGVPVFSGLPQSYGIYYKAYPIQAASRPGVVYPAVAKQRQLPYHRAWPVFTRFNHKQQSPLYYMGKSQ